MSGPEPRQLIHLTNQQLSLAACRDMPTEEFFPDAGKSYARRVYVAKIACNECVIKNDCLRVALFNREEGVWGGTTAEERADMRRAAKRKGLTIRPQ